MTPLGMYINSIRYSITPSNQIQKRVVFEYKISLYNLDDSDDSDIFQTSIDYRSDDDISEEDSILNKEARTFDFTNKFDHDKDVDYKSDLSISLETKSVSDSFYDESSNVMLSGDQTESLELTKESVTMSQESHKDRSFERYKSNKGEKYGTSESIEDDFTRQETSQLTLGIC